MHLCVNFPKLGLNWMSCATGASLDGAHFLTKAPENAAPHTPRVALFGALAPRPPLGASLATHRAGARGFGFWWVACADRCARCASFRLWNGAFSPRERYTREDIQHVVAFAREHGVRVMVEIDIPGHAASWCTGYPEVCPSAACNQPLNVASNETYKVIDDILAELLAATTTTTTTTTGAGGVNGVDRNGGAGTSDHGRQQPNDKLAHAHVGPLFPYELVHLGGDEVEYDCWSSHPTIIGWLAARGMSPQDGYGHMVRHAAAGARKHGRRPVHWDEVWTHFRNRLAKSTVIHVWTRKAVLVEVVRSGFHAILSSYNAPGSWYLDLDTTTWHGAYGNEPCDGLTQDECAMVLGGQGQLWGELVDISNLEAKMWPRLAAIAERLWSPRAKLGTARDATARLIAFRCLLVLRGVGTAPVTSASPQAPGSCYQ